MTFFHDVAVTCLDSHREMYYLLNRAGECYLKNLTKKKEEIIILKDSAIAIGFTVSGNDTFYITI